MKNICLGIELGSARIKAFTMAAVSNPFPPATTPGPTAAELTTLFDFNIPQRWSIAYLYVESEDLLGGVFSLCDDKATDASTGVSCPSTRALPLILACRQITTVQANPTPRSCV